MRIGVPKETAAGERRVALVPELVAKLTESGIDVVVEPGAGEAASFTDEAFREAGAGARRPLGRRGRRQGAQAERRGARPAAEGAGPDRLPPAADRPGGIERLVARA